MTKEDKYSIRKSQDGQSFVEFVMLLAGISIISFSFMKNINSGIAEKWKNISEIVLNNGEAPGTRNYKSLTIR